MIKQKISDSVYHIYVEKYPDSVEQQVYRGDHYSFTLVGFNNDDTPFDFGVYDELNSQLRLASPKNKNKLYTFTDSEIVLGKTNASQNEFDEIHVTSSTAIDFSKPYPKVWCDIEGVLGTEHKTLIKIKLSVDSDVTR